MTQLTPGLNAIGDRPASWKCDGVSGVYTLQLDWRSPRKSKKATLTSKTALVSVADAEARMRTDGAPQLNGRERKRYAAIDSHGARSSVMAGCSKGAAIMRERAIADAMRMLAEHPERRTQHCRTMVSDEVITREGKPFFRVRCETSGEALHSTGQWARGHGAGCRACSRKRQGAGSRKQEGRAA